MVPIISHLISTHHIELHDINSDFVRRLLGASVTAVAVSVGRSRGCMATVGTVNGWLPVAQRHTLVLVVVRSAVDRTATSVLKEKDFLQEEKTP